MEDLEQRKGRKRKGLEDGDTITFCSMAGASTGSSAERGFFFVCPFPFFAQCQCMMTYSGKKGEDEGEGVAFYTLLWTGCERDDKVGIS